VISDEQLEFDGPFPAAREVVITGIGILSPIGIGVHAFWDSLSNGHSGRAGAH
jgi:3-oxoacyl-(acyl-carrier-protein) synthase